RRGRNGPREPPRLVAADQLPAEQEEPAADGEQHQLGAQGLVDEAHQERRPHHDQGDELERPSQALAEALGHRRERV
ncbi:hypothetical protein DF186_18950, partial [Enterococcus hirae]